jgi:hypothetical protein
MTESLQPAYRHSPGLALARAVVGALAIVATLAGLAAAFFAGEGDRDATGGMRSLLPALAAASAPANTPQATATVCNESANQVEEVVRDGLAGTLDGCTGAFVPYTPTPTPSPEPTTAAPATPVPAATFTPRPPPPPAPTATATPTEAPHVH